MRIAWIICNLFLFLWVTCADAVSAPDKPKQEVGPMELDFSALGGTERIEGSVKYKIHIAVQAESGVNYRETFTIEGPGGFPVPSIRNSVRDSIESAPGWKVKAVGKDKLVIEGHKESPVRIVDIKVEGLPAKMAPTARRVPKSEK